MSEENTQKLAQSLIGIYSMIYGAIEHKATKKGLQMPVCLEPDDAKNMDFEKLNDFTDRFIFSLLDE